ncbi:MAG: hypothetical protein ACIAXF_15940 [Phycisphaerales bacterium JB063]
MDFIRRNWTQIQAQVGDWSFTTKWLIVSLAIILLLVGGIFVKLAAAPQMVPISQVAEGGAAQIVAHLDTDGITNELRNGQVYVSVSDEKRAIATLAANNLISQNAYAAFDQLVSSQSWMTTNRQSDQQMRMATGRFLGTVIGEFPGVDHAYVVIDKPDTVGIGLGYVPPSAMVTVNMKPGGKIDRRMADALISLVRGAVADLPPENVMVIDASNRREFTARDAEGMDAGTQLEHLVAQERMHKQKIEDVLSSFPGATIAVKIVQSQVVSRRENRMAYDSPAVKRESTTEMSTTNVARMGEPGVRPNTGASIDGGGATGQETTSNTSETEFSAPLQTLASTESIAGGTIRLINVSVAIPRSYFVRVFKAQNPDAEAPSDEELAALIDAEKQKITQLVQPQLVAMPTEGEDEEIRPGTINIAMVYDQAYLEPVEAGAGGGLGAVMSSGWAPTAMVAGLAVISLVLMLGMVKKATRTEEMPSLEELAGVPPTLPSDDDLMGEVDEMDGGLAGVELEEGELRSRQIAEQISEMVKANPEEAGGLLSKWVGTEKL